MSSVVGTGNTGRGGNRAGANPCPLEFTLQQGKETERKQMNTPLLKDEKCRVREHARGLGSLGNSQCQWDAPRESPWSSLWLLCFKLRFHETVPKDYNLMSRILNVRLCRCREATDFSVMFSLLRWITCRIQENSWYLGKQLSESGSQVIKLEAFLSGWPTWFDDILIRTLLFVWLAFLMSNCWWLDLSIMILGGNLGTDDFG